MMKNYKFLMLITVFLKITDYSNFVNCERQPCIFEISAKSGFIKFPDRKFGRNVVDNSCMWIVQRPPEDKDESSQFLVGIYQLSLPQDSSLVIETDRGSRYEMLRSCKKCLKRFIGSNFTITAKSRVGGISKNLFESGLQQSVGMRGMLPKFAIEFNSVQMDRCQQPKNIENGFLVGSNYKIDNSIMYVCLPPYRLEGKAILKCKKWNVGLENGLPVPAWNGPPPSCILPQCKNGPIALGAIYGKTEAIVNPGYGLKTALPFQTCLWNIYAVRGDLHVRVSFHYLEIFHGTDDLWKRPKLAIYDGSLDKLIFDASAHNLQNFKLQSFTSRSNRLLVVYETGQFVPRHTSGFYLNYTAISITCPTFNSKHGLAGIVKPIKKSYWYGDTLVLVCKLGHLIIDGASRIVCQANGTWSNKLGRCIPDRNQIDDKHSHVADYDPFNLKEDLIDFTGDTTKLALNASNIFNPTFNNQLLEDESEEATQLDVANEGNAKLNYTSSNYNQLSMKDMQTNLSSEAKTLASAETHGHRLNNSFQEDINQDKHFIGQNLNLLEFNNTHINQSGEESGEDQAHNSSKIDISDVNIDFYEEEYNQENSSEKTPYKNDYDILDVNEKECHQEVGETIKLELKDNDYPKKSSIKPNINSSYFENSTTNRQAIDENVQNFTQNSSKNTPYKNDYDTLGTSEKEYDQEVGGAIKLELKDNNSHNKSSIKPNINNPYFENSTTNGHVIDENIQNFTENLSKNTHSKNDYDTLDTSEKEYDQKVGGTITLELNDNSPNKSSIKPNISSSYFENSTTNGHVIDENVQKFTQNSSKNTLSMNDYDTLDTSEKEFDQKVGGTITLELNDNSPEKSSIKQNLTSNRQPIDEIDQEIIKNSSKKTPSKNDNEILNKNKEKYGQEVEETWEVNETFEQLSIKQNSNNLYVGNSITNRQAIDESQSSSKKTHSKNDYDILDISIKESDQRVVGIILEPNDTFTERLSIKQNKIHLNAGNSTKIREAIDEIDKEFAQTKHSEVEIKQNDLTLDNSLFSTINRQFNATRGYPMLNATEDYLNGNRSLDEDVTLGFIEASLQSNEESDKLEKNPHIISITVGAIVATLVLILIICLIVPKVYRRKYPVRMTFGRKFATFKNPSYQQRRR